MNYQFPHNIKRFINNATKEPFPFQFFDLFLINWSTEEDDNRRIYIFA